MHGQMELGIVPFYGLNEAFNNDASFEFFPDFTPQGFLWRFPRLHLPSRKLPAILEVTVSSLGGEDTAFVIMYDCCYDFDLW